MAQNISWGSCFNFIHSLCSEIRIRTNSHFEDELAWSDDLKIHYDCNRIALSLHVLISHIGLGESFYCIILLYYSMSIPSCSVVIYLLEVTFVLVACCNMIAFITRFLLFSPWYKMIYFKIWFLFSWIHFNTKYLPPYRDYQKPQLWQIIINLLNITRLLVGLRV